MLSACDINIREILVSICKVSVKTIYDLLVAPILKITASQSSILIMLNIVEITWKKVYPIPRKVSNKNLLIRVFQYKILNIVLYLNNRLY